MGQEVVCPHCGKTVKLKVDTDPPAGWVSIEVDNRENK